MEELEFTQLALTELRQDAIKDFNIAARNNYLGLLGSKSEVVIFELITSPNINGTFPYNVSTIEIPKERPCSKAFKNVRLPMIYEKCNVLERQELALDPLYVAECALDPVVTKIEYLDWAPMNTHNNVPVCALLTTPYGACQLLSKMPTSRKWTIKLCDINEVYANEIFPMDDINTDDIKTFTELSAHVECYLITALVWDDAPDLRILYTTNAAGYIVALQFSEDFTNSREYCRLRTDIGRISYIKAFHNFLLISNARGVVNLYKIDHNPCKCAIYKVECLWSKADRMSCRKAEITYVEDLNSFFVIFAKAAHLLAYRLTEQGKIVGNCSSTLYVGDIKITDLAAFTNTEFIVTSITGAVRHIGLSSPSNDELNINEQIVKTEIDQANMQVLGVATTPNRNIWSFLLYRNKEYTHQSKVHAATAFLSVCKINTNDALQTLANVNIDVMDNYIDYAIVIRMDLLNNFDWERYNAFFDLQVAKFPKELNDTFLQKLQIKLMIVKAAIKYQDLKYHTHKKRLSAELEFLEVAIQITHIYCRLQYMQNIISAAQTLNPFQTIAAKTMCAKHDLLILELKVQIKEDNPLKDSILGFIKLTKDLGTTKYENFAKITASEDCTNCGQQINASTLFCPNAHMANRCCVSFMQLSLFKERSCLTCNAFSLPDDDLLQQLFEPGEFVKCTFCRFKLKNDRF